MFRRQTFTSDRSKGATALVGAAFLYACFGPLVREMAKSFSDAGQTVFRFGLAFVIAAAVALVQHRPRLNSRLVVVAVGLGVSFGFDVFFFTVSVNETKLANTIAVLYGASIITSLIVGSVAFHESLTRTKFIAIGLALGGLAMYSSALAAFSVGVVAAIAAGIADGLANGFRKASGSGDRFWVLAIQYAIAAMFLVPVMLHTGPAVTDAHALPIVVGVVFAIGNIALGNLLLYGFSHYDVNIGTVILTTELVFAAVIGAVLYDEIPAVHELVGAAVIFVASACSALEFGGKRRTELTPTAP